MKLSNESGRSASPTQCQGISSRWLRLTHLLIRKLTELRYSLWQTLWLLTTDKLLKLPQLPARSLMDTHYVRLCSLYSMARKIWPTVFSLPLTLGTENVSCPTCDRYLEAARNRELTKPSLPECLELRSHFQSTGYKLYDKLLQRSRVEVLARLEKAETGMKLKEMQGALRLLRNLDNLPAEIDYIIYEYEKEEEREKANGRRTTV